jgi:outer membrane protein assembly factor BamB
MNASYESDRGKDLQEVSLNENQEKRLLVCLVVSLLSCELSAENWPGWRGPRGDGTSLDRNVPTKWSGSENVAWKVAIPGVGHASPIIWEDRIIVVTCLPEEEQRCLICLDRKSGQQLWMTTALTSPLERKHKLNSFASSTPVTDGERVYVSFLDRKDMFIAAYDFQGNRKWAVRPGPFSSVHGYCSSPILYKDTVIINGDHDGDAYIVALEKDSGKTRWKSRRENKTRSYCTPIIRDIDGRTQMILSGSMCVASYDPDDGSRHWIIDGPTEQYVASLVYDGELIYLTCGFPQEHLMGIRPDGKGNVTDTHVVWHHRTKDAAYVPSPIVVDGYFIIPDDFGTVTCYEARSGELQWREKLARHYSASALETNGLVYLFADQGIERDEEGVTTIIKPGPKLEIVTQNTLGEPVYASPAVYDGQLFLRSQKHLYCIGAK